MIASMPPIPPMSLIPTVTALRTSQLDLLTYINAVCDRINETESYIHALMPERDRRARLLADAVAVQQRYPDPEARPPLYGALLGVKDIFFVDGFPTTGGSQLPPEVFVGAEAACVSTLCQSGAIMLGKTVSTEFAYYEPGPTRNPHNLNHTPGGSSSGSAAAVAAGYCPLAFGTQTIGSIIRPAAFCGIVGFKPSYGRISTSGLIGCSGSVDTVGFFTQDVAGIALVASLLCANWQSTSATKKPVIGVPQGPYLQQASKEGLTAFEQQLALLEQNGYIVRRVNALNDIEAINARHMRMVFAEMAAVHQSWFAEYEHLYRPRTVAAIREGQTIESSELAEARAGRRQLRRELETTMDQHEIDIWVCPAAPGTAPKGIGTTGNSSMNLPWTHAGLPAINIPAGKASNGLPLGLQYVDKFMHDEELIAWAEAIAMVLK